MKKNNYLDVLKHPIIARLTLIQFISYFGTWFSQVAIASMMLEYGASELAIAYIFMMLMLPAIVLAPISGWIIDNISIKLRDDLLTLHINSNKKENLIWIRDRDEVEKSEKLKETLQEAAYQYQKFYKEKCQENVEFCGSPTYTKVNE